MRFPICRKPYPDELFYGYIVDLCLMNDIRTLDAFKSLFAEKRFHVSFCFPTGLHHICDEIQNRYFPDIHIAARMTPQFYPLSANMDIHQVKIAEAILNPETTFIRGFPRFKDTKYYLHICPVCWQEDTSRYGQGYLHVSHHVSNLKVCLKHRIPLLEKPLGNPTNKLQPFDPSDFVPSKVSESDEIQPELPCSFPDTEFVSRVCPTCSKTYIIHLQSEASGLSCPFCMASLPAETVLQSRLDALYPGEYRIHAPSRKYNMIEVRHIPCGAVTRNYHELILGIKRPCKNRQCFSPSFLQNQIDPERKQWIFTGKSFLANNTVYAKALHVPCGKETNIIPRNILINKRMKSCPFCTSQMMKASFSERYPDYEVLGEYKDDDTPVTILHKPCGNTFQANRKDFHFHMRCPFCIPNTSFNMLQEAIRECCPEGYSVRSKRNGFAQLTFPDGTSICRGHCIFIDDLMSASPVIFTERRKRYEPTSATPERPLLKSIREAVAAKGFWTYQDDLAGKDKFSRKQYMRVVEKLVNLGMIRQLDENRFTIE